MDSVSEQWRHYFLDRCQSDLETLRDEFPSRRSIYVDLISLHEFDSELTQAVFEQPAELLAVGTTVIRNITDLAGPVNLRVEKNPHQCSAADIQARHLYDLITVEGVVESVGSIQATLETAHYECPACDESYTNTPTGIEREKPTHCENCGWTCSFRFRPSYSRFVDSQRLTLTSASTVNQDDSRSEPLAAYLTDDVVGEVTAENHYCLTGILRASQTEQSNQFEPYLSVLTVQEERGDITTPDLETLLDSHFEQSIGR